MTKVQLNVDWLFYLLGVILNIVSIVFAFYYGHEIAGMILVVCELILIGLGVLRLI